MALINEPSPTPSETLDAFKWRNRIVLSFVSKDHIEAARDQREHRENARREWQDRDLVLIEVGLQNDVTVDRKANHSIDGAKLRQRFAAGNQDYVSVLVGKDGFEKLRVNQAIANDILFATIDAMPMRQQEMQNY